MENDNASYKSKNISESLKNLQKILSSEQLSESLLTKTLLIELYIIYNIYSKQLQKFCPNGVYIVPQFDNINIWHGVLFVREGYYKDGIFKFEIDIPKTYPQSPPTVKFISKVVHPLINRETNILDLSMEFANWNANKNFLVKVIYYIHDIFEEKKYLMTEEMSSDKIQEISECVKESISRRYENKENCSIKFSEYNPLHQLILNKILNQDKDISTYEKMENFKNWFMNNFMEILQTSAK